MAFITKKLKDLLWTKCSQLAHKYSTQPTSRQLELMARSLPKREELNGVKNIVVVASGKGGVGKSTTSVNLAVTLAQMGQSVGLLDADVFDNTKPIVWRGPLVMSALQRLLKGAVWGPLDILIVDTPPGTGDIHLSLSQHVPVTGALLVSTPQTAALEVTRRGAEMYKTLNIALIGLVENMSHATCSNCGHKVDIFERHTEKFVEQLNVELLERIPIVSQVAECSDTGKPLVLLDTHSEYTKSFRRLGEHILNFTRNSTRQTEP
ncbi:Iron-sulfur protein NUBPL [Pseudolycoriella hygida]|uniref:Iron-sulfur protein NUBPL n=1 Tax=Pseudolycoriella hygida TaxID=35572 RepID=A0A9Q0S6Q4_9DIPT|nr:Iron-sulfur protein NUBPL [Pseudolycoriella hygida]